MFLYIDQITYTIGKPPSWSNILILFLIKTGFRSHACCFFVRGFDLVATESTLYPNQRLLQPLCMWTGKAWKKVPSRKGGHSVNMCVLQTCFLCMCVCIYNHMHISPYICICICIHACKVGTVSIYHVLYTFVCVFSFKCNSFFLYWY